MNRIIIIVLSVFLISCENNGLNSQDEIEFQAEKFPQKWELVKMSGMVANEPPAEGNDMDWQESYVLKADGAFIKSRVSNEEAAIVTGLYKIVKLEDGEYLKLSHESFSDIIGNCTNSSEEYLRFESVNSLIGTWWACDGPGLFYERTQ